MTDQEVLAKALNKAISNGLDYPKLLKEVGYYDDTKPETMTHWQDWIFRHDFAKALWGKKLGRCKNGCPNPSARLPEWESHLQLMVIADDPIKYLEVWM